MCLYAPHCFRRGSIHSCAPVALGTCINDRVASCPLLRASRTSQIELFAYSISDISSRCCSKGSGIQAVPTVRARLMRHPSTYDNNPPSRMLPARGLVEGPCSNQTPSIRHGAVRPLRHSGSTALSRGLAHPLQRSSAIAKLYSGHRLCGGAEGQNHLVAHGTHCP
jgi:hypothetical protein